MENLFCVKNEVVLITGSSRGIGLELARGFLKQGAHVAILSENAEELADALKELDRAFGMVCDVRSFDACREAVRQIVAHFGTLTRECFQKWQLLIFDEFLAQIKGRFEGHS